MPLVKFKSLHLNNFLSFKEQEISLENKGFLLVHGQNGSGKSSLTGKALIWGLFGQTPNGMKTDTIVRRGEKSASVSITFETKDGKEVTLIRSRAPNSLKLYVDGEDRTRRHQNETQAEVVSLLGSDFTSFVNINYFGQGNKSKFLSLQPANQIQVLEEILGLESWDKVHDYAKSRSSYFGDELKKLEKKHATIEGGVSQSLDQMQTYSNDITRLENEIKTITYKLTSAGIEDVEKKIKEIEELISKKQKEIEPLRKYKDYLEKASATVLTLENKIALIDKDIISSKSSLVDIKETCPTCGQAIDKEEIQKLSLKNFSILNFIEEKSIEIEELRTKVSAQKDYINKITTFVNDLNLLEKEAISLNQNKCTLQNKKAAANVEDNREELRSSIGQIHGYIEKAKKESQEKLLELKEVAGEIEGATYKVNLIDKWAGYFRKDIKYFAINRCCAVLESRANFHLQQLGKSNFKIKISTLKDLKGGGQSLNFNIQVYVNNHLSVVESLSGGEQQILSFATGMALGDLSENRAARTNLLILDEPFTELDPGNSERLVQYINGYLVNKKSTIVLISNDDRLKNQVPNSIYIENIGGVSVVRDR